MNLIELAEGNLSKFGEYRFLLCEGREFTNLQMMNHAISLAGAIRGLNIERGQNILVMMRNCPEVLISYQGILRSGAVVVPVVPTLTENELAHIINVSESVCIITTKDLLEKVKRVQNKTGILRHIIIVEDEPLEDTLNFWKLVDSGKPLSGMRKIEEKDLAVMLFTAGTTGMPKGVMLTHRNLSSNAVNAAKARGTAATDISLIALPLSHSFGLTTMNIGFLYGNLHILMGRFDVEEAFKLIEKYRVTTFPGVPTMFAMMLHSPLRSQYDLSTLKNCTSSAAPMPVELMRNFEKTFDCAIYEAYGLSEASPALSINYYNRPRKPGSIGQPLPEVDVRIVDEDDRDVEKGKTGELIARGPNISSKGYYKMEEESAKTFKNGWLYTGDMARMDEDGYIYIVERKKDMIIRGGFNIYPRDIEEVLYRHPAVRDAVVIGVPHPVLGEEIKVFLVLKEGERATSDDILQYCGEHIAKHQVPKIIEFIDAMPRNAVGKILRRELRKRSA